MKNKSTLVYLTIILTFSLSLLSANHIIAQEYDIFELNNGKTHLAKDSNFKNNDRAYFYDLSQKLHPTIYIVNNVIKTTYGSGPLKKITIEKSHSYTILYNKNSAYHSVELLTLKLESRNDLNYPLDLSQTSDLENLKYVFIKCYFKYNTVDLEKFIKVNENVRVFHISANPS